jgi:hypothetical protein
MAQPHSKRIFSMDSVLKFCYLGLLISIVTACSGTGLSAQCEAANDTFISYQSEVDTLWEVAQSQAKQKEIEANSEYQRCLEDPQKFEKISGPGKKFSWYSTCDEWRGDALGRAAFIDRTETNLAYRKMQLVVENNQSCFTPAQVVEAQIYLGTK